MQERQEGQEGEEATRIRQYWQAPLCRLKSLVGTQLELVAVVISTVEVGKWGPGQEARGLGGERRLEDMLMKSKGGF